MSLPNMFVSLLVVEKLGPLVLCLSKQTLTINYHPIFAFWVNFAQFLPIKQTLTQFVHNIGATESAVFP
jgi:hypothetical protein